MPQRSPPYHGGIHLSRGIRIHGGQKLRDSERYSGSFHRQHRFRLHGYFLHSDRPILPARSVRRLLQPDQPVHAGEPGTVSAFQKLSHLIQHSRFCPCLWRETEEQYSYAPGASAQGSQWLLPDDPSARMSCPVGVGACLRCIETWETGQGIRISRNQTTPHAIQYHQLLQTRAFEKGTKQARRKRPQARSPKCTGGCTIARLLPPPVHCIKIAVLFHNCTAILIQSVSGLRCSFFMSKCQ